MNAVVTSLLILCVLSADLHGSSSITDANVERILVHLPSCVCRSSRLSFVVDMKVACSVLPVVDAYLQDVRCLGVFPEMCKDIFSSQEN